MKRSILILLVYGGALFGFPRPAFSQCAMCSEALRTASDRDTSGDLSKNELKGLPLGIFKSIVVMLGSFFALAGSAIYLIIREGRKSDAEGMLLAEAEVATGATRALPGRNH